MDVLVYYTGSVVGGIQWCIQVILLANGESNTY